MKHLTPILVLLFALFLAGCGGDATPTAVSSANSAPAATANTPTPDAPAADTAVPPSPTHTPVPPTEPPPTDTPIPPSPTATATAVPTLSPLPADPQRIEFSSEDGRQLVGDFYPAGVNPAPIAILMHEGGSDRSEVEPLALWMQNRPDEVAAGPTGQTAYDWLPPFPDDIGSMAVFTFDMRGHGESEGPPPDDVMEFLMDIRAAIALVKTFEGVDPDRIITLGSSMFAEAALNGCIALDGAAILPDQPGSGCVGVLSISPFGFYPIPFDQATVALLNTPPQPIVWCLHAENDYQPETCRAIDGMERTRAEIYPGNTHGADFFQPGLNPDFGEALLEFVQTALGG